MGPICLACGHAGPTTLPRYRHYRRGDLYEVLAEGMLTGDVNTNVVIYRSLSTGLVWVRPKAEFFGVVTKDGVQALRFARV